MYRWIQNEFRKCTEGVATNIQAQPPADWVTPAWLKEAKTLHWEEDDVQG